MQIYVDRRLVKRNALQGKISLAVGFAAILLAIFYLFQVNPDSSWDTYLGAYAAIIIGFLAFTVGSRYFQEWVRSPIPFESLVNGLHGSHKKSALFSYLPHLHPIQHVFVSPAGVFILIAKHCEGTVVAYGDQWKLKPLRKIAARINPWSMIKLGSPIQQATSSELLITKFLEQTLGAEEAKSVPVKSIVVFTNVAVNLDAKDPTVPAVTPDHLRSAIGQLGEQRLQPAVLEKIIEIMRGGYEPEEDDSKPHKGSRGRRRK